MVLSRLEDCCNPERFKVPVLLEVVIFVCVCVWCIHMCTHVCVSRVVLPENEKHTRTYLGL